MNYFIAPRSGERSYKNYQSSIKHGVAYETIEPFLSDEGKRLLLAEPIIYAWGNRPGTSPQWERMELGDKVIFYAKGELVMVGEVYFKQHHPGLALAMWPPDEKNNPWEYTYFLKNISYIKLPMKAFNVIAGYKSNFIIQGFMHLRGEHLALIEQQYGNMDTLLEAFKTDHSGEMPRVHEKLYVNVDASIRPIFRSSVALKPKLPTEPSRNQGIPRKIDYTKKSKNNALTGSKGEALVVEEEKRQLVAAGRQDLAGRVKRVSVDDDTLGYDVLSFDVDGSEKCIEVKSSGNKTETIRFYMSANEMAKSKLTPNYFVYYVDGVHTKQPRITSIKHPFEEQFLITTDTYLLQAEIV